MLEPMVSKAREGLRRLKGKARGTFVTWQLSWRRGKKRVRKIMSSSISWGGVEILQKKRKGGGEEEGIFATASFTIDLLGRKEWNNIREFCPWKSRVNIGASKKSVDQKKREGEFLDVMHDSKYPPQKGEDDKKRKEEKKRH